jgi:hypothetical protein
MDAIIRLIEGAPDGRTLGDAVIDANTLILYRRRGTMWDSGRPLGGGGAIVFPTTDPHIVNAPWLDDGTITISSG